jgi:dihydropyrimidine dehydrogenase (NAD+) subunit PreA
MAVDLSVDFLGIHLKNPFMIASVPSATSEGFQKAAKAGWAGAITWAGGLNTHSRCFCRGYMPREFKHIGKEHQMWAYLNTLCLTDFSGFEDGDQKMPPERIQLEIGRAKESGIVVGCNIAESSSPISWARCAKAAEKGGADFLELNFSCPWVPRVGFSIGIFVKQMKEIVKAVKDASNLPVMAKLNASLDRTALAESADAVVESGAEAISITNTLAGVIGVDIETTMPIACELDVHGKLRGYVGGISGPAIKPMGLRGVAELSRVVDVPISGIGGITDWQSAVEYILLGASTIQIGTAVMLNGYKMIRGLVRGLEDYMEKKGYQSVNDFVGLTSEKYVVGDPWTPPAVKQPRRMVVDVENCNGCGLCVVACDASSSEAKAIRVVDRIAEIDRDRCQTCYACMMACPSEAISVQWEPV